MYQGFIDSLGARAKAAHPRIGIGLWKPDPALVRSLAEVAEYADIVIVGGPICGLDFECVESGEPWKDLVEMLAAGEIDGAVRGNLPAGRTMRAISSEFGIKVRRLALMDLLGWSFLLGPVGIDEGETLADRLALVTGGARFLKGLGVSPRASILSGGRMEDVGRSDRVDRSLADGELMASLARNAGVEARHRGILIEECRGDDIIIAPEGVSGNLIFRTLLLLCGAESLGAPVLMEKVFVDSSRARGDFNGPVMLASAMAGMKS